MSEHLAEIGAGWHPIVQPLIDQAEKEGAHIHQIKEKFAGLRFYVNSPSLELCDMIDIAEKQAAKTCEYCGAPGECRQVRGSWLKTVCQQCFQEHRK